MNETKFNSKASQRYSRRGLFPRPNTPHKVYLNELSHRLISSITHYFIVFLCGILMGLAIWFNAPPLLILIFAILPFLGSLYAFLLGVTTGSFSFAGKSLLTFMLLTVLYFLGTVLVGWIAKLPHEQLAPFFANLEQPSALLLIVSAITTFSAITRFVTRRDQLPESMTTAAMSAIWLPLGVCAFNLGSGAFAEASNAFRSALMGLAVSFVVALIALYLLRLFTVKAGAFIVSGAIFAASLLLIVIWIPIVRADTNSIFTAIATRFNGTPAAISEATLTEEVTPKATKTDIPATPTEVRPTLEIIEQDIDEAEYQKTVVSVREKLGIGSISLPNSTDTSVTVTATATPIPPTATKTLVTATKIPATATRTVRPSDVPTATPVPPTATMTPTMTPTRTATKAFVPTITATPTRTLRPSSTPTLTFTVAPPANYAVVHVENDVGVLVRISPEFNASVMKSVLNGSLLELMGEEREVPYQNFTWVRVRTNDGYIGWVGKSSLQISEPLEPSVEP